MFTFLNTFILAGLAAVAIPVLIHLFTRQQQKVINFSSLRFLKELQQQKIRRLKIRQILLLLLRALFILLLVLAFARPALKGNSTSSLEAGAQLTAVLILDNTMSMARAKNGLRLVDVAKKRASEVVDLLRPGDEMYVLYPQSPAGRVIPEPRYTPEAFRDLLDNTGLAFTATDYHSVLENASELMRKSNNVNKEVYLITDQQKSGLCETSADSIPQFDDGVRILALPVGAETRDNLTIVEVKFGNQIFEVGKTLEVVTTAKNNGTADVSERLLHLFVNGKRQAQAVLNLVSGATQTVTFNIVPDSTGLQAGYLLLEDDDLLADNKRFFCFYIPVQLEVLLVGQKLSDTRYLRLALTPEQKVNTNISTQQIDASAIENTAFGNYDVVVLSNVARLTSVAVQQIQRFVADGGGLMLLTGPDVDLRNYNDGLHKRMDLPALGEIFEARDDAYLTFGNIDFSHAIFYNVFTENREVGSPYIHRAVSVRSEKPIDKIIEYGNGMPFLFESRYRKGRVLYLTTGLADDWSDLRIRGLFAPLLNRCITYLSNLSSVSQSSLSIGDEIVHTPDLPASGDDVVVYKPDGAAVKLAPEVNKSSLRIRFAETDLPGIYKLHHGQNLLMQWAVNTDPLESDTRSVDVPYLQEHFQLTEVSEVAEDEDLASVLQQSRFGYEMWKLLIALALVILLLETFILKERRVAGA